MDLGSNVPVEQPPNDIHTEDAACNVPDTIPDVSLPIAEAISRPRRQIRRPRRFSD
jgi:hypothetical protein